MTVLDFGCGIGFLAKEVATQVSAVVATDVSKGAVACAKTLNGASNISYIRNSKSNLAVVNDSRIDLVYSFAVFQHLERAQSRLFLREFKRVLKPGGLVLCHVAIGQSVDHEYGAVTQWVARRAKLRMDYLSDNEVVQLLEEVGFRRIAIRRIADLADIGDEIGSQHLATFQAPE